MRKLVALFALTAAVSGLVITAHEASAGHRGPVKSCAALNAIDPDNDGRLDLFEANRAALKLFDRLNPDKDRTLELDELHGRVSPAAFDAANRIKHKGLDRLEWLGLVRARFNRANPDRDFTIECDELRTPAGRALYRVLY